MTLQSIHELHIAYKWLQAGQISEAKQHLQKIKLDHAVEIYSDDFKAFEIPALFAVIEALISAEEARVEAAIVVRREISTATSFNRPIRRLMHKVIRRLDTSFLH